MNAISSVPITVPSMVPRPPDGAHPPMMQAAMMSSSSALPAVGCAAHARCCSVLRKAPDFTGVTPDWSALTDDEAQALLRLLSRFPDVVLDAADK